MGIVYVAEQVEPVRRRVAIKVIKVGMDTREVIARFASERQALALMSHPNIARILDAGATETGRPYFVMELVSGIPITDYCNRQRLRTSARLELFVKVCDALQHAHQKGVIHRDIKPNNILVSEEDGPVPKVIDFGVAKATNQQLTEHSVYTQLGRVVGTPVYMSPEQAEFDMLDVDTRSDVYSLGVVLYELLVGVLPFELEELGDISPLAFSRLRSERDPKPPSSRLSKIGTAELTAKERRSNPRALTRRLRGELDWITMKALERDRADRYGSPAELAADIERHLNGDPVLAGPRSALYRTAKFVSRHKVGVAFASVLLITLVTFAIATTVQSRQIARERDRAQREARTAAEVSEFLVRLFEVSDPDSAHFSDPSARDLLDEGARRIESELTDAPEVRARLMATMGRAYSGLGLYDAAQPLLERSLEVDSLALESDHGDRNQTLLDLAELARRKGELDRSLRLARRVLADLDTRPDPDPKHLAFAWITVGIVQMQQREWDASLENLERARELQERTFGSTYSELPRVLNNIAIVHWSKGDEAAARPYFERALAIWEEHLGPDHPQVAGTLTNLGMLFYKTEPERARPYERALAIREKALDPDHPDIAESLNNLGNLLRSMREWEEALAALERAVAIREKTLGPEHPTLGTTIFNIGLLLKETGRHEEARPHLERALRIFEGKLGTDHPHVAYPLHRLGNVHEALGDHDEARRSYVRAIEIRERSDGADRKLLTETVQDYAEFERAVGNEEAAMRIEERMPATER